MKKLLLILLTGCGLNGTQKFEVTDSTQRVTQDGTSFTYVIVRPEYIKQIQEICENANPMSDFISKEDHDKAVAQCTIENMKLLNINLGQVDSFKNKYCVPGADLSGFTPQQVLDIQTACNTLK